MVNIYPTVSIIVPAYNAEKTIGKCLESLTSLDYPGEYEVILVNNKSTDNTVSIAKKYDVRIIDALELRGSYYARNAGLANTQAEIVAFTDADCIADKKWLYYLVQPLIQDPKIGGVGGAVVHIANNAMETVCGKFSTGQSVEGKPPLARIITANAAYKRKILKGIGFFDETFFIGGDVDLSWRVINEGYKIKREPRAIIYHHPRKTPYSFFKQHYGYGFGWAEIVSKHKINNGRIRILDTMFFFKKIL